MNNEIIDNILNILFDMCYAEGGDGDSTWYTQTSSLQAIILRVEEYNKKTKFPWEINFSDNETIWLSKWPEECVVITSNIEIFKNRPTYARIEY